MAEETIQIFTDLTPEGEVVLVTHGCAVEYGEDKTGRTFHMVSLPEGSKRTEILGVRTVVSTRFRITLPDGFEIRETYDHFQKRSALSAIPQKLYMR